MKRKYCALWFPTIYQRQVSRVPLLKNQKPDQNSQFVGEIRAIVKGTYPFLVDILERVDISDGSDYPYYLTLGLDCDGNIYVKAEIESNIQKDEFIVKLEKEEAQEDGIVLYSFDSDCIPNQYRTKFEQSILPRDVYHRAKLFYHEHEADEEKDCGLKAYVSNNRINIKGVDNVYLRALLVRFSFVMEVYAMEISEDNKLISKLESLLDENREDIQKISKIDRRKHWQMLIYQTQILNRKCQNASLEYTYVKNLLNSKYNKSFRYTMCSPSPVTLLQDVCRTKALNIRNSAQYVENIKQINYNRISRILDSKLEESRLLQEELKHSEEKNSVVSNFSAFLAALFGGAQIVASVVSLIAQKGENKADWVFLLAGIVLVCSVRIFKKKLAKIKSNKEDNN